MRYKQSVVDLKKILKKTEKEILGYPKKCKEYKKITIFIKDLKTRIKNYEKIQTHEI